MLGTLFILSSTTISKEKINQQLNILSYIQKNVKVLKSMGFKLKILRFTDEMINKNVKKEFKKYGIKKLPCLVINKKIQYDVVDYLSSSIKTYIASKAQTKRQPDLNPDQDPVRRFLSRQIDDDEESQNGDESQNFEATFHDKIKKQQDEREARLPPNMRKLKQIQQQQQEEPQQTHSTREEQPSNQQIQQEMENNEGILQRMKQSGDTSVDDEMILAKMDI